MASYLTLARYRLLAAIPGVYIDDVEHAAPGFTESQLEIFSAWLDSKLAKRYAAPFRAPYPIVIEPWLARLVTPQVMLKRGVNSTDEQWTHIVDQEKTTRTEVQEAANAETGLYDLPLRADTDASGIARGFPAGYSEASPYVWTTIQAQRARQEDDSGSGTSS